MTYSGIKLTTPAEAIAWLENRWGWLGPDHHEGPSDVLGSCYREGSVATPPYDLGIGYGEKGLVVLLGEEFFLAREIWLVNQARLAAGCPAAVPHDALMRGAQSWTEKMHREHIYQHSGGDYYKAFGHPGGLENIGSGGWPEWAFDGWMMSPLHKRNLQWCYHPDNPSYSPSRVYDIGVGYMGGYWTLVIGVH